jgi:hypothetical protein
MAKLALVTVASCTGSGKSRRGWPAGTLGLGAGVCPRSGVFGGKLSVIACNSWAF